MKHVIFTRTVRPPVQAFSFKQFSRAHTALEFVRDSSCLCVRVRDFVLRAAVGDIFRAKMSKFAKQPSCIFFVTDILPSAYYKIKLN